MAFFSYMYFPTVVGLASLLNFAHADGRVEVGGFLSSRNEVVISDFSSGWNETCLTIFGKSKNIPVDPKKLHFRVNQQVVPNYQLLELKTVTTLSDKVYSGRDFTGAPYTIKTDRLTEFEFCFEMRWLKPDRSYSIEFYTSSKDADEGNGRTLGSARLPGSTN
ncbi:MAG: hypothetical protein COT74_10150 [Bdellovibrionales bacterium CG10_big_fil_rev_8_21_14_0_10_45_34]|nr:MAG: hypothetical protein COT74_10150 [Bdellovibrionales bacterium CG10_big_fil_rev_8_21_14_0_10_45_34]